MGKLKTKKRGKHRVKPTGLQSTSEALKEQLDIEVTDHMLPHLEELSSPSADTRECACACLANLVSDSRAIPQMLKLGVVKRLGSLLVDESERVRLGAAGCLRNLTLEGHETCASIIEDDVMSSLVVFFRQSIGQMQNLSPSARQSVKCQTYGMVEQALHLLWNLTEGSPVAVSIFNQQNLMSLVLHCLQPSGYPLSLVVPAAQCLYSVSEDNTHVSGQLAESAEALCVLKESLQCSGSTANHLLLRVITAGVLFNISRHLPIATKVDSMHAITQVLSIALDVDIQAEMKAVVPALTECKPEIQDDKEPEQVMEVKTMLTTQQLALEVLANFCCADGDSSDDGEWEDTDDEANNDDELVTESNGVIHEIPPLVSADKAAAVVTQCLPEKALSKCKFADPAVYQVLGGHSAGQHLIAKLNTVQSRALVALHNLLSSLCTEALYSGEALCNLWNLLFHLASGDTSEGATLRDDEEFLEAVTGALRSVLQRLKDTKVQCVSSQQIALLCSVCHSSKFSSVRANIVGMLGIIGTMIAQCHSRMERLVAIGTALVSAASCDHDLWVVAEALDAIFDVFGDGDEAMIAAEKINLLKILQQIASTLKKRMRAEKKHLGSRVAVVDIARNNLQRFIRYLKTEGHT
ncbi:HEAT repeat-containing protein 3-like [Corticium candelabrum]|uniref:HEAT repeat-containing protein 3-like n=1 Tax=Corticium candelabrum TaxID=121492 RepID=UPI002E255163|nr:HEAT repeat-containing protein 3-like [Corticium candelabrum]